MAAKNMDVFSLRDRVVDEYRSFATSFTTIYAEDIRQQVEAIYAEDRYWPEPLIQINPSYRRSTTVGEPGRVAACSSLGAPRSSAQAAGRCSLYKHQEQAIALAVAGRELRRHHGHRLRQVALLLHPDRRRRARREGGGRQRGGPARSSSTR